MKNPKSSLLTNICVMLLSTALVVCNINAYKLERRVDELTEQVEQNTEIRLSHDMDLIDLSKRLEGLEKKKDDPIAYERSAPVTTYDLPLDEDLQTYTAIMCRFYDIEEHYELALAIMWQESNFKADAISITDDYGLMQINKCNHEQLKEKLGLVDLLDPWQNIEGGTYLLASLLSKYEDTEKVLMAYNLGPSLASSMWNNGTYSSNYSRAVMQKLELIKSNQYTEDI